MTQDKINSINRVVIEYFLQHPKEIKVQVKTLMPWFIKAGIFPKDEREGLPIRKILRSLDKNGQLKLIPSVLPERKAKNTNWFFTRTGTKAIEQKTEPKLKLVTLKFKEPTSRLQRDEHYIVDLCDEVLKQKGSRQHKFDFLLGDPGKIGSRAKLPVDVYYSTLNLVIEYREVQHTKEVKHFDKPDKMTVSGMHRGLQRKRYDELRRTELPKHKIKLIEVSYDLFPIDTRGRLLRQRETDLKVIQKLLQKYK